MSNQRQIECPRCGQKNPSHARYCMYCGERLVQDKKITKPVLNEKKELNVKVLYLLLGVLTLSGLIILYFAGVFDSDKVVVKKSVPQETVGNNHNATTPASTPLTPQVIDLKTLQELKQIEKSIEQNPANTAAMVELGNRYFDFGHFKEAIKFYKMYLEELPNSPDVLVDLGVSYYNLKDYPNAEKYMEKAVKINPHHQIALYNLGVVNEALGNIEAAKSYWNRAIEVNPNSQFAERARSFLNKYN